MRVRIVIKSLSQPTQPPKTLDFSSLPITLGREESNNVVLPSKNVSRNHAIIIDKGGNEFYLKDQGSFIGTILNQRMILPNQDIPLLSDDVITIGDFELQVKIEDFDSTPPESNSNSNKDISIKDILSILPKRGHITIRVLNGPDKDKSFSFTENSEELLIGRDLKCHLVLTDATVSRHHAKISLDWGGEATIVDLNSKNGTTLNNEPLTPEKYYHLKDRDYITLGLSTQLVYCNPRESVLPPIKPHYPDKEDEKEKPSETEKDKLPEPKIVTPPPGSKEILLSRKLSPLEITFLVTAIIFLTGGIIFSIIFFRLFFK
ncbi:MAG: FHA domain-containing protein [bacterium]